MNGAKLEKQKNKLVKNGFMKETEILVDCLQVNYLERLIGKWGNWKSGWAYFTEERLIVLAGVLTEPMNIPYQNIRKLDKCMQGLIPMGVAITYEDAKTGKTVTDKISLWKRDKWIAFMAEKAHLEIK